MTDRNRQIKAAIIMRRRSISFMSGIVPQRVLHGAHTAFRADLFSAAPILELAPALEIVHAWRCSKMDKKVSNDRFWRRAAWAEGIFAAFPIRTGALRFGLGWGAHRGFQCVGAAKL
jgi:hypothetical protein